MKLQEHLAALREAGVRKALVEFSADGEVAKLDVEFELASVSEAPFVDEHGKPVNLDEGMPELTHDPIAAKYGGKKPEAS